MPEGIEKSLVMIELTVKTLDSQNHPFSVPDDTTVKQLKERIAESINVPVDVQRMIYCGRVLQDEKALSEYDVNGKVIHLVQRPPPQANSSGADQSSRSNSSTPGQQGRRALRHSRIDGNAMYLGAMAFPADLMDAQGIQPPQPSHSLSRSRLTLAMQMLNRAKNSLAKLENPEGQESPGAETPPEEAENGSESPSQPEGGEAVPSEAGSTNTETPSGLSQAAAAAAIAAAVSAAQSVGVPSITIMRGGDEQDGSGVRASSDEDLEISEREEVVVEGTIEDGQDTLEFGIPESGNSAQPPSQDSPTDDRVSRPRTSVMASVMDELNSVQERLQPFLQQYHQLMRDDPSYEGNTGDARSAQRVFGLVSEVMHFLSHAYHAMSDIMCDFSMPPPRILRCRPVLIQHSAVLQAGIPIQAQFNLVANRGTNTGNGQFVTRDADSTTEASAAQAQAQPQNNVASAPVEGSEDPQSASTTANDDDSPSRENDSSTHSSDMASDNENLGRSRTRGLNGSFRSRYGSRTRVSQNRNRTPRAVGGAYFSPQSFSISPADVEVFMEVGPSSITIDSMETRVLDSSVMNGSNGEQTAGGNFPAPEFIQNLMQAMAGHVMGRVGTPAAAANNGTSTTAASTTTTTTTSTQAQAADGTRACQNSQARGNTATHPTTATQTRSTSRPHVHLPPSAMHSALGTSNFDPFLPCNSHHIRSARRRRAPRMGHTVSFSTDRPPRSVGVNVGFIPMPQPEQPSQSSENSTQSAPTQPTASTQPTGEGGRPEPNLLSFLDVFGGLAANILSDANSILSESGVGANSQDSPPANDDMSGGFQQFLRGVLNPDHHSMMSGSPPGMQTLLQGLPLFQVISGSVDGHSPSLVEILQNFAVQPENEGEHLFTDFVMTLARGLTFQDLRALQMGSTQPLQELRPQLREFVQQRILQGESQSAESIARGVDRLLAVMRPHFDTMLEVRIREDVDIVSTVNLYHQIRLPEILEVMTTEGENSNFGNEVSSWWNRYYKELLAILLYCCVDKNQGLETIVRTYLLQATQGANPVIQQTAVNCCLSYVRNSVAHLTICPDDIQTYVVYRMGSTDTHQASAPPVQQMETDVVVENQPVVEAREELPEVLLGTETWHNEVPSDWVPIISRDVQRQRRQNPQAPFSDAYLSGMPSKRRKVVTSAKPQGNLDDAISETVRSAIETAGVGPVPLREVVSQAAGSDPAIQAAYSDRVRSLVQDRLANNPDYSSDRFPNTAKYFSK